MRESQEQQKRDNENSADKPEKAPAKKHLKDDKETDHIDSQSNKKNMGKQLKKRPVKSRADKSKETRKQLSNIANKTTAENEGCTKATREIYRTFMAAFQVLIRKRQRVTRYHWLKSCKTVMLKKRLTGQLASGHLAR